jgi:arylformamidase
VPRLVDLSHTIRAGMVTYPGLPVPTITPHLTREESRNVYDPGTEFAIDVLTMIGNTGTYLDSPYHRYEEGGDLASLELETLVRLPAEVFHPESAPERGIRASDLGGRELGGSAVLLHTGWDRHFGRPQYGENAPFLTEEGAAFLVDAGVLLVGIDSVNIDDTQSGGSRPAHSLLLDAGIHIVEHLTALDRLPDTGALFTAVPPKIESFGTFPVRAFAEVP